MSRFTSQYWKGMSLQALPFLIITIPWALALYFMLRDRPGLIERPLFWATGILPVGILAFICSRLDR
jgi:hypothetical protein